MSIIIESWARDGAFEIQIACTRVKRVSEIPAVVERLKQDPSCVVITKGRSDNQSSVVVDLWIRPGYTPVC